MGDGGASILPTWQSQGLNPLALDTEPCVGLGFPFKGCHDALHWGCEHVASADKGGGILSRGFGGSTPTPDLLGVGHAVCVSQNQRMTSKEPL